MEYLEIKDVRIPKLGLGTWKNTGETCTRTVQTALEMGYRHVDTAQMYGNESAVGEGIAAANITREDLFLTTKLSRSNLRRDDVHASVRDSLDKLGVEYVDLLLIHWPHPRVPVAETLDAMNELYEKGLVKNLGVSNFTRSQFQQAMQVSDVPLITDQVLYHPYSDRSQLRNFCTDTDTVLTAYSPLARGDVLSDRLLKEIGKRYEKTAAQVAIRWLIQQDGVIAIPKATSRDHLADNLAVFDFSLSDGEMAEIEDLTGNYRIRLRNQLPSLVRRIPF
ncbi:aldo/keto reductase [Halostella sp. PRR32]|uniref:aldo/keto reductase n=1 Tax=Halostella sp. PRR32 TaxID=3098147 RepID=UPI002B1DC1A8|nr:aldo/keto reductase [Halostella sp. PRR32]